MNLNRLSTTMMINLSELWVSNDSFRSTMTEVGPLGVGILNELDKAHAPLTALQNNRNEIVAQQRELIDQASDHDDRHDSLARGVHYFIRGFIECTQDPVAVAQWRRLLDLLFPLGLAVTKLPYVEECGAAITLQKAVKPEVRAQLEAIQLGPDRLVDHFDAWMNAARKLGEVVVERADLTAASTRDGTNGEWSDVKAGRLQWISAVRGLLWALDREPKLAKLRESVVVRLQRSIAIAQRRAALPAGAEVSEEDLEDVELEASEPAADDDFGTDTVEPAIEGPNE